MSSFCDFFQLKQNKNTVTYTGKNLNKESCNQTALYREVLSFPFFMYSQLKTVLCFNLDKAQYCVLGETGWGMQSQNSIP